MSLSEVYQLYAQIREHMGCLGHWQALTLALYSVGVVLAEKCIPSKVSEKCAVFGKPETVQRRLERWLDNERIRWWVCCREWARWVLSRYVGEQLILLVDETKLGAHLSVMVVALAYRGSAIPLAYWCYHPKLWPEGGQVGLISELLSWVLEGLPEGCVPLVQADRGIGCSPKLVRSLLALRWHFLLRIQRQSKVRLNGQERTLQHLVNAPGQHYSAPGQVFKKAGWLSASLHAIWEVGYKEAWFLISNAPDSLTRQGWLYACRYWQEAAFRDLKSDGWHWQSARIFSPDHANRLLLVLCLAYAWMLTLGTCAFDDPALFRYVAKSSAKPFALFRLGLRLFNFLREALATDFAPIPPYLLFADPPPLSISVGA
jgi:hypothetical protein